LFGQYDGLPIIHKRGQAPFKTHALTHLELAHVEKYNAVCGAHQFELVDVPVLV
jgi:hypothetical protein